jgi:hypothetical protein
MLFDAAKDPPFRTIISILRLPGTLPPLNRGKSNFSKNSEV